jgi:hypothetical protein
MRVRDLLKLLDKRLMMTINSTLDTDTATMLAREFGGVQMRSFEEELRRRTRRRQPRRHRHARRSSQ